MPPFRALGDQATLGELGRAFADAGLPNADALIHELGLIRGQRLLLPAYWLTRPVRCATLRIVWMLWIVDVGDWGTSR